MIDRNSRDLLAELIHRFVAGRISNDQFHDEVPKSRDCAIEEIFWNALWGLYDDMHEHYLVGRYYIPRNARSDLARCVLFLKSNLEYEWTPFPPRPKVLSMLASLATFGLIIRVLLRRWSRQGDLKIWPFIRDEDYRHALARPPYLAGVS